MQTATYDGEEISVVFSAQDQWCDYGVPNSPRWLEVDPSTVRIESVQILGVGIAQEQLACFPAELILALHALANEVEFTPEDE